MVVSIKAGDWSGPELSIPDIRTALESMLPPTVPHTRTWIPTLLSGLYPSGRTAQPDPLDLTRASDAPVLDGSESPESNLVLNRIRRTEQQFTMSIGTANLGRNPSSRALHRAVVAANWPHIIGTVENMGRGLGHQATCQLPNGAYHGITRGGDGAPHGVGIYVSKESGLSLRRWENLSDDDHACKDCIIADVLKGDQYVLTAVVVYNPPQKAVVGEQWRDNWT